MAAESTRNSTKGKSQLLYASSLADYIKEIKTNMQHNEKFFL
jgi:hypothetical protein